MTVTLKNRRKGDWLQNLMLSAVVMMLGWIIQQLFALSAGVANIQPRLTAIEVQVSAAYRAADARRDLAELDARIKRLERVRWHGESAP